MWHLVRNLPIDNFFALLYVSVQGLDIGLLAWLDYASQFYSSVKNK